MTAVSCSDGANGLITRYGWQNQGAIPNFPYIGGSDTVASWNSPNVCTTTTSRAHDFLTVHPPLIFHLSYHPLQNGQRG